MTRKVLGAGGRGFKVAKSADLIKSVRIAVHGLAAKPKFTAQEISWLADAVTAADDAPPHLLQKLIEIEVKFGKADRYLARVETNTTDKKRR